MATNDTASFSRPPILRLSVELILLAASYLEVDDLHALTLTSKLFHARINPELYKWNARHRDSSCLHWAAQTGELKTAQLALENKAGVNRCRPLQRLRLELDSDSDTGEHPEEPWISPLHHAAEHGHQEIVALLLSKGAHIDAPFHHIPGPDNVSFLLRDSRSRRGGWINRWPRRRALHVALAAKHCLVAELLVTSGASLDFDDTGLLACTALHVAARSGLISIIELLARKPDFNVNQRDTFGNTALHYASMNRSEYCTHEMEAVVLKLLSLGANIEASDYQGATPLMFAYVHCSRGAAKALVGANADIHAKDSNHRNLLYYAVTMKLWDRVCGDKYEPWFVRVVRTLISRGVRIDHPEGSLTHAEHLLDPDGTQQRSPWTASLWEAYHNKYFSICLLLQHATCRTTLMWESVKPVLDQPLELIPVRLFCALLHFAKKSLPEAELTGEINTLMDAIIRVSPSRTDKWYDLMLFSVQRICGLRESKDLLLLKTIRHQNQRLCRRLLELQPPTDLSIMKLPGSGSNILHLACDWGERHVVKDLIRYGADVNALDHLHRLPLSFAILNNNSDIAGVLVEKMSMPAMEDPYYTVFQLAIDRGHVEILTAIVEKFGCPSIPLGSDFTYVHLACQHQLGQWKTSSALDVILSHGADPNGGHGCPNSPLRYLLMEMWENPSPADLAATILDPIVLLIRHGAKIPHVFYYVLHYSGQDIDRMFLSKKLAEKLGASEVDKLSQLFPFPLPSSEALDSPTTT
ncbi:ankyrin [Coniochaeta ligniaria NRRL 30616]|uniref:Ankyrin n=1 Tax=Coniochaeta ligniaria NRRL 30616 TaxID=1408157 RepID=A0A1J7I688_9PEZI|nr:ankyrin [Coniochaeta ligniaria NRRL 30616]